MEVTEGTERTRSLRIFVVEDHSDIREMLSFYLPTLGHWVESADSASTASERLRQDGFDVLLTDFWEPDAGDWCLLSELEMRGNLPPYVVSTSASVLSDTAQRSQAAGCYAHLQQPFRLSEAQQIFDDICLAIDAARVARRHVRSLAQKVAIDTPMRTEAVRIQTESRLIRAILARNIELCKKTVEESRQVLIRCREQSPHLVFR